MNKAKYIISILLIAYIMGCTSEDVDMKIIPREILDTVSSVFLKSSELITENGYITPSIALSKNIFSGFDHEELYKDIFKKVYIRTYGDNQKLRGSSSEIFRFLFIYNLYYEADSAGVNYSRSYNGDKNNPVFTAYSILVGSGIDSEKIGDPSYIKLLAESFGIEAFYVRSAIFAWLEKGVSSILVETAEMIGKNTANFTGGKEQFLVEILVPYMQMVLTGRELESDIESQIMQLFKKVFDSGDELKVFINAYRKTMTSRSFHVKYLNNLNSVLKKYGYYMTASDNDCSAYKIVRSSEKLSLINGSRILMLKKISIGLTSAFYGYVRVQEKDIILLPENLDEEAEKLYKYVNEGDEYNFYTGSANKVWEQIGLDMTTSKADSIRNIFMKREFKGMSLEEIRKKLEISTIIHEIKHLWDDVKDIRNKHSWNMDSEFSAYMSQAILSDLSYANLFSHIATQENFYLHSIHNEVVCNHVDKIVTDLWELIQSQKDESLNPNIIISELKKLYAHFKTMDGYKLPSLNQYEKELPSILVMTDYEGKMDTLVIKQK